MKIDINTKMVTLIGTPLGQSFAARMQNAGYEAAGMNLCYFYTEADVTNLSSIINGIRNMPSFAGCAITKPNKVRVLHFLDELDPLCWKMGSCNTVVRTENGELIGYNTDGIGFYRSLIEETDIHVMETSAFCLGAGGAARAICSVLAYYGVKKIYVTDKLQSSTQRLVEDINRNFAPVAEAVDFGDYSKVAECNLVMNNTGVGMGKSIGKTPMSAEYLKPDQWVFDACYNPTKTQFLLDAEAKGCRILNGLGMSLYQGVAQIELWTGQKAPVEAMRQELLRVIEEKEREA